MQRCSFFFFAHTADCNSFQRSYIVPRITTLFIPTLPGNVLHIMSCRLPHITPSDAITLPPVNMFVSIFTILISIIYFFTKEWRYFPPLYRLHKILAIPFAFLFFLISAFQPGNTYLRGAFLPEISSH